MVVEGKAARLATVPMPTRPSTVAFSNSAASASSCNFHHAASSASFAKVFFFSSSNIAIPLLRQEVQPEPFLGRPRRHNTNFLPQHGRNNNQNSRTIRFAYLNGTFLATAKLRLQIARPILNHLLRLCRNHSMLSNMATIRRVPLKNRMIHFLSNNPALPDLSLSRPPRISK